MAQDKIIKIFVNRVSYDYKKDEICYKDVLKLIDKKDNNPNTKPLFTIMHNGEKLLKGGNCIHAYDRMEFTIGNTTGS